MTKRQSNIIINATFFTLVCVAFFLSSLIVYVMIYKTVNLQDMFVMSFISLLFANISFFLMMGIVFPIMAVIEKYFNYSEPKEQTLKPTEADKIEWFPPDWEGSGYPDEQYETERDFN